MDLWADVFCSSNSDLINSHRSTVVQDSQQDTVERNTSIEAS